MADSPTVDNGVLTDYVVSSDEVTIDAVLGQVQRVKLVDGANGGTALIGGDATNGLDVDVTRVIPGTTATALGKAEDAAHTDADTGVMLLGVREYAGAGTDGDYSAVCVDSTGRLCVVARPGLFPVAVTSAGLTIATTAYTAGDQLGNIITIANAARVSGGGGYITHIRGVSAQDALGSVDMLFYDRSVTLAADNAAAAISDADALFITGEVVPLSIWDVGNNRVLQSGPIRIPYTCNATSLFSSATTKAGHTFFAATTDIQWTFTLERS